MNGLLLFLHVLGATIWTGGHIVLSFAVLPKALKEQSAARLQEFESSYEKIGMPALVIQVITGIMLGFKLVPEFGQWFDFSNPVSRVLCLKLLLLAVTLTFALHAKFRVIPKLNGHNLVLMAWHIVPVTIISVLFVLVGVSFKAGWFY